MRLRFTLVCLAVLVIRKTHLKAPPLEATDKKATEAQRAQRTE